MNPVSFSSRNFPSDPPQSARALSQQEVDNARSARTAAQATVGALEAAVS